MPSRPDENLSRLSPNDSELQKPLENFRAKTRRVQIHPAEKAVLWVVCAHLVFLPWAIGTMRPWAQITSLAFSAVSFLLALLPRNYTAAQTGSTPFRLLTYPKLIRFPIFWIGLALLAYVTVQGLNPAWTFETDGKNWWMRKIPAKAWLPVGVHVPFVEWGQWRMLVIYSSTWLTVCTVWVGFTRRRTIQLLLMTLAFNGLLVGIFGIVQRLLSNGKIYWFVDSLNPSFFASFVYKNHAGAYLDLTLAVIAGLAGWYYLRGLRRMEKSNPSGVLVFFATCVAVSVLMSYARGATLIMLVFLLLCIVAFVVHQIIIPRENRKPIVAIALLLIFGFFVKTGLDALGSGAAWMRLKQGINREDLSLEYRERATHAALEMLQETWRTGVGAGSFRHTFPTYQYRHPEIVSANGRGMYWEHAHNDLVQFPIELGITGAALIVIGLGYWLVALTRSYFWANPLSACVVLGLILLLVYAWWDFPFQCPAILITWCALWPVATHWARFEEAKA